MYIAAMTPSKSKNGGWNVLVRPHNEFLGWMSDYWKHKVVPEAVWHKKLSSGKYWLSDAAVGHLTLTISHFLIGDEKPRQQEPSDKLSCFGAMYLRDNAPDDLIGVVYRALSKVAHPDTPTGSHERMKRLNAAYEECKRRRGL